MLRYAAIDIGSNAIRLLIADILIFEQKIHYKKNTLIRVPLRLGDEAFIQQEFSEHKKSQIFKTMLAFKSLMDVYGVQKYLACATSAMRDAENGAEITAEIKEKLDLDIEIIEGQREAHIIYGNHIESTLNDGKVYLYIDVGGGSTELSIFADSKLLASQSFNLGTIRMLDQQDDPEEWLNMKKWLKSHTKSLQSISGIGTGGNINKLFRLSQTKENEALGIQKLKELYLTLRNHTLKERIQLYGLNPDRADVIIPAAEIFLFIMKASGIKQVFVPKVGLADGIINLLIAENKSQLLNANTTLF